MSKIDTIKTQPNTSQLSQTVEDITYEPILIHPVP